MITKVTRARLKRRDHYRFQVNANDNRVVAYCYNALADYLPREATAQIRNRLADVLEKEIRHQFNLAHKTPAFQVYLQQKYLQEIEPALRTDAKAYWQEVRSTK